MEYLSELQSDRREVQAQFVASESALAGAVRQREAIEQLLEQRQGEVTLRQILEAQGRREFREVMERDLTKRATEIVEAQARIAELESIVEQFGDRKRSSEIAAFYRDKMRSRLRDLDVRKVPENSYKSVTQRVAATGSDGPRALLAQVFSTLGAIFRYGSGPRCPVIVDSPKQQDQDPVNFDSMVRMMRHALPKDAQLIVGTVDADCSQLGGKEIIFSEKYHALQQRQFPAAYEELDSYVKASLR